MNEWKLASDHSHIPGKDYEINMNTQFNGFISGNYEVRFLQDDRLTVCVIRNLKRLDERYTGVTVLNPKDKFDAAIGRHKAFKEAMDSADVMRFTFNLGYFGNKITDFHCGLPTMPKQREVSLLPIFQLHTDYWKRYENEEK